MDGPTSPEDPGTRAGARIAAELIALRSAAGQPSYAEIADRVSARRQRDGADPAAARIARSTVYDCFRTGRVRMNLALVREIVAALGADAGVVDRWLAPTPAATTHPSAPEQAPGPGSAAQEPAAPVRASPDPGPGATIVLMAVCVGVNLVGRVVVDVLDLPVYLDMVGTAIAAIALGPWRGAAVGLSTNLLGAFVSTWVSLPFAIVNVAGALVWGYGVRRLRMGRSLPRFFTLNLAVAGLSTLLAVPILVALFDGSVGQGQDTITATFQDLGNRLVVAVGLSNLLTSVADKLISGFVALVAVAALPGLVRGDAPFAFLTSTGPPPGDRGGRSRPTPGPTTDGLIGR